MSEQNPKQNIIRFPLSRRERRQRLLDSKDARIRTTALLRMLCGWALVLGTALFLIANYRIFTPTSLRTLGSYIAAGIRSHDGDITTINYENETFSDGALYGVIGRIGMIAASVAAAKYTAPYIAQWVVVPAVGQLFEKQAALKTAEGVLDGLRQTVTEAAVGMSESIAFSMLVVLFSVLFGRLIWIFGRSLKLIVRRTPLSALDSAGGALIGFVTGIAFVCILLIVLQWLFPITYTSLGYLSPERVKHTLLLKQLVDALPIAI